jgi:hypothetical protein
VISILLNLLLGYLNRSIGYSFYRRVSPRIRAQIDNEIATIEANLVTR